MISATMFLGGCSERIATIDNPCVIGNSTQTVMLKLWNIGSRQAMRSSAVNSSSAITPSTFRSRLLLLSIAPFGLPVVPEV